MRLGVHWASPGRLPGHEGGKQEVASVSHALGTQVLRVSTKKTKNNLQKGLLAFGYFLNILQQN
jgi:hypothetical protein